MKPIRFADLSYYAQRLVQGVIPWTGGRCLTASGLSRFSLDDIWEAREYERQERNARALMNYRTRIKPPGLQLASAVLSRDRDRRADTLTAPNTKPDMRPLRAAAAKP